VFIFDKKKFESQLTKNNIIKKGEKQVIYDAYEVLRNQVANLTKFRHPNVLTIIEPLEEHKANFMFVTEPLTGCLNQAPELDDVTIQKGLLQITNALKFVHTQAHMIHLGLAPNSVFINDNSDWKLSGFGYIQSVDCSEYFIPQYDPRMPGFLNINLNFTSPEVVLENTISPAVDMFSLGALIYYLYNEGSTFISCNNSTSYYKEDYARFERSLTQNNPRQIFKKVPESLFKVLPQLINRYPNQRISPDDFIECDYFNNPLVKVMVFLDEFPTKNDEEKLIFLRSLINLLPLFPPNILQKKILPIMIDLLSTKADSLIQITLNILILIGENMSQLSFHDKVFPVVSDDKLLQFQEAQIVILENLHILKVKVKSEEFKKVLLKLTEKTLDLQNNFQVQAKTLERMDIILQAVDFPNIKNNIFPKICTIFAKTTSLNVKIKTIDSFVLLIEKKGIDKFIINETLLPLLKSMKTRELKIMRSILKVYQASAHVLDEEHIVEHVISQLWVLSMAPTMTTTAYEAYTSVINDISKKIQVSHMEKLKVLEGSMPPEDEDDTEKFRHLLYGKEDTKPQQPVISAETLQPTINSQSQLSPQVIKPKIEPMTLHPKKKSISDNLNFGSVSGQAIQPVVKTLRKTSIFENNGDDEFEDFVSAPQSRTSPAPQIIGIDWSTEWKLQQPYGQSAVQQQQQQVKLPPGFGDSTLIPMKKNSNHSWDNGTGSLI
jgi:SCY1-like protein 2